jgi:hypothetical protein
MVTLTPTGGYGFYVGRVRVTLEYPRVTRDNHYLHFLNPLVVGGVLVGASNLQCSGQFDHSCGAGGWYYS